MYFTFYATEALPNFVQRIVGDGSSIGATTRGIYALLVVCSVMICAAFICNFSRSLWMLKNRDHAVFEPVPQWEQLTTPTFPRISEFGTRMAAALLFIYLEFKLEKLGHPQGIADVKNMVTEGLSPTRPLSQAGFIAIFLYVALLLWWVSGRWIVRTKMPRPLFWFFVAGLFNSFFIYIFGDAPVDESSKIWLLISIAVAGGSASFMVGYVVWDLIKLAIGLLKRPAAAAP